VVQSRCKCTFYVSVYVFLFCVSVKLGVSRLYICVCVEFLTTIAQFFVQGLPTGPRKWFVCVCVFGGGGKTERGGCGFCASEGESVCRVT
jgi:hypothetical protein